MVGSMLVLAGTLNLFLYPTFLRYQAGMATADYVNEDSQHWPTVPLYFMNPARALVAAVSGRMNFTHMRLLFTPVQILPCGNRYKRLPQQVFTTAEYADSLETSGFQVKRLAMFPYYHVSQLTYDFLNPATRSQTLLPYVLAEVVRAKE